MPVYEYRCQGCGLKTSVLWRNYSPPDTVECKKCGSEETTKVISRVAFHKSLGSKLADLDPRYDRMVEAATERNSDADPRTYLDKATPLSEATE